MKQFIIEVEDKDGMDIKAIDIKELIEQGSLSCLSVRLPKVFTSDKKEAKEFLESKGIPVDAIVEERVYPDLNFKPENRPEIFKPVKFKVSELLTEFASLPKTEPKDAEQAFAVIMTKEIGLSNRTPEEWIHDFPLQWKFFIAGSKPFDDRMREALSEEEKNKIAIEQYKQVPLMTVCQAAIIKFGEEIVNTEAGDLTMSTEADIQGSRYKITTVTTIEELPSSPK